MFFLLFFAVFDFARLFYAEMTLQNAVRQAGRYAVTGNHLPDPQHQGQNLSRVNSIIKVAQQAAGGLSVSHIQISSLGGGNGSAGGPGDTVTISLTSTLQLMTPIVAGFFPNGAYTFTVSVSFKNEPFPPGNTG
jgi:Flp pilus assembly protein TadG